MEVEETSQGREVLAAAATLRHREALGAAAVLRDREASGEVVTLRDQGEGTFDQGASTQGGTWRPRASEAGQARG